MGAELNAKRAIVMLTLLSFCVGCSSEVQKNPEAEAIRPQVDQVQFFERPVALAAARKSGVPLPLIVLLESDPWAQVLGSDSPAFALYEDGTVIRRAGQGFAETRLTPAETNQLLEELNPSALARSYGRFRADDATDQPEQDLLIYQGSKPIFVSVYGSLNDPDVRAKVPQEVVAAYDTLRTFSHVRSRPWRPEHVELMIWPYEYAPGPSNKWPEGWPDLNDPRTVRRGEDSFSIFLPSAMLADLRAFRERTNDRGAVEIDGRKWATGIRFPFPQESLWMAPNLEADEPPRQ